MNGQDAGIERAAKLTLANVARWRHAIFSVVLFLGRRFDYFSFGYIRRLYSKRNKAYVLRVGAQPKVPWHRWWCTHMVKRSISCCHLFRWISRLYRVPMKKKKDKVSKFWALHHCVQWKAFSLSVSFLSWIKQEAEVETCYLKPFIVLWFNLAASTLKNDKCCVFRRLDTVEGGC